MNSVNWLTNLEHICGEGQSCKICYSKRAILDTTPLEKPDSMPVVSLAQPTTAVGTERAAGVLMSVTKEERLYQSFIFEKSNFTSVVSKKN